MWLLNWCKHKESPIWGKKWLKESLQRHYRRQRNRSVEKEWSYMNNWWDREFGHNIKSVKHILPGTSLFLALDHVFFLKIFITKRKNVIIWLLCWPYTCRVLQTAQLVAALNLEIGCEWVSHIKIVLLLFWLTAVLYFKLSASLNNIANSLAAMFSLISYASLGDDEDLSGDFVLTFTLCHCVQMTWTMSSFWIQWRINNTYET